MAPRRPRLAIVPSEGYDVFPALLSEHEGNDWHELSGGGLPCPVLVRLGVDTMGRLVCTGLLIGHDGSEVTSTTLRGIPVKELTTYIAGEAYRAPDSDVLRAVVGDLVREQIALRPVEVEERVKPGRKGPTDRDLATFMRRYGQAARQHPTRPIAAVAEKHHMSKATVHRWLDAARSRGITGAKEEQR